MLGSVSLAVLVGIIFLYNICYNFQLVAPMLLRLSIYVPTCIHGMPLFELTVSRLAKSCMKFMFAVLAAHGVYIPVMHECL